MTGNAMLALARVLSKPEGFMVMYRYNEASTEMRNSACALEPLPFEGLRTEEDESAAPGRFMEAVASMLAYRDSLVCMLVAESGFELSRHEAIKCIIEELYEMRTTCHQAIFGWFGVVDVANRLAKLF